MRKTLYLNVEDDVTRIIAKVKAQTADQIVLVVPKDGYLFSDAINLKLLKKQIDVLGKYVAILTMDKEGRRYAQDAGFELKRMSRVKKSNSLSDVHVVSEPQPVEPVQKVEPVEPEIAPPPRKKRLVKKRVVKRRKRTKPAASRGALAASTPQVSSQRVTRSERAQIKTPMTHIEETESSENVFIPPSSSEEAPSKKRSLVGWVLAFVVVALVTALLLGLVVLPGATVFVRAQVQPVDRDLDVIVDSSVQIADSARLKIPAQKIDQTTTAEQSFTVNGKQEIGSKAEGRVALINLSGSPLTLRASTTVLTVGTKNYVFKSDQGNVVPVTSAQNTSGATVADIVAQEGGEDFNLPAGTRVEITNEAFGSQPQVLYATTVSQVIGGSSRFVSVLTQDDIAESQKALTRTVVEGINADLEDGVSLVDGAYAVDVQQYESDKEVGEQTTNYEASANIAIRGLAFDEQELKEMVRMRLQQTLGAEQVLQSLEADTVVYKIQNLDLDKGIMELSIHYESVAVPVIDERGVLLDIVGKSKQEASDLILTNPDVESVQIELRPFWQSSLPRVSSKIELVIETADE